MLLLPVENIIYYSSYSAEEITKKLKKLADGECRYSKLFPSRNNCYGGSIEDDRFSIVRCITYRNSFLPKITGVVRKNGSGSAIRVKMRMHLFVSIFMTLWIVGTLFSMTSFGILMSVFGYGMTIACFKAESYRSRRELGELFNCKAREY